MYNSKSTIVHIIDFGMGNLFSVKQACEHAGLIAIVTSDKDDIMAAEGVILPGVGAYDDAMKSLNRLGMIDAILSFIRSGKPFLGICLGMQLLMSESEEFGKHRGLDVIEGRVVKFPIAINEAQRYKVPQVGWNQIRRPLHINETVWEDSPLAKIHNNEFMYFVHSYYCKVNNVTAVLSTTRYAGIEYCSTIFWENIFATQYHPEKSSVEGLKIYKNWAMSVRLHKGDSVERKIRS